MYWVLCMKQLFHWRPATTWTRCLPSTVQYVWSGLVTHIKQRWSSSFPGFEIRIKSRLGRRPVIPLFLSGCSWHVCQWVYVNSYGCSLAQLAWCLGFRKRFKQMMSKSIPRIIWSPLVRHTHRCITADSFHFQFFCRLMEIGNCIFLLT